MRCKVRLVTFEKSGDFWGNDGNDEKKGFLDTLTNWSDVWVSEDAEGEAFDLEDALLSALELPEAGEAPCGEFLETLLCTSLKKLAAPERRSLPPPIVATRKWRDQDLAKGELGTVKGHVQTLTKFGRRKWNFKYISMHGRNLSSLLLSLSSHLPSWKSRLEKDRIKVCSWHCLLRKVQANTSWFSARKMMSISWRFTVIP